MSFEFAKKLYSEKKYKKAIEQYQIAITEAGAKSPLL